jgi:hypothetical protein
MGGALGRGASLLWAGRVPHPLKIPMFIGAIAIPIGFINNRDAFIERRADTYAVYHLGCRRCIEDVSNLRKKKEDCKGMHKAYLSREELMDLSRKMPADSMCEEHAQKTWFWWCIDKLPC